MTSLSDICLALSNEEADEAACGVLQLHEVMASTFLHVGLELEEEQR